MPEITNRGWARMDLADNADRKLLIESGVIWRCGKHAVQMAVQDLLAGVVPMNDKVPPEIVALIQKIQASRAKLAPNGLDATPPPAEVWACLNGHVGTVVILTSRKGRVYGACTTCHAFERGDVLPNAATPVPASVPDPKVDPKRPEPSTVDEYCALLSEEDAAAYRKGIAQLARAEEEHDAYMRAKPRAANVEPRSRPASPHVQTDDEYCALLSEEDAVTYRKDRANLVRAAHEADELFKRRLILAIIVVIIFVVLLSSGSLNSWLNSAPECYDRSCFGGGA